jgi:glycosyltransferase involved in cell wall biosynthesis
MKLAWIIQGEPYKAWSYFVQIKLFSKYLNRLGYHSHIINFTDTKHDIPQVIQSISDLNPNVILSIGDNQILDLARVTRKPVIFIVTNGIGIAPPISSVQNSIFACTTYYAQKIYQKAGIFPSPYFPHGFDPDIFYPGNREAAKKRLGWTHTEPTILMLGTNYQSSPKEKRLRKHTDRKNFIGGIQAFSLTLKHKPDLKLYLHTNSYGAINLIEEVDKLDLSGSVILADLETPVGRTNVSINSASQQHIADLYRASNLLLFPSLGESFGVPILEAQACGLPVITTDAGPMPELVYTGTAVKAAPHPTYPGWGIPDTSELSQAILKWTDNNNAKEISQKVQVFSAPAIIQRHLLPILNTAQADYH